MAHRLTIFSLGSIGLVIWSLVCLFSSVNHALWADDLKSQNGKASLERFTKAIEPFYQIVRGERARFHLEIDAKIEVKDKLEFIQLRLARFDNDSFDFTAEHPEYAVQCYRRDSLTALVLPRHQRTFIGTGSVTTPDTLAPKDSLKRLSQSESGVVQFLQMLSQGEVQSFVEFVSILVPIEQVSDKNEFQLARNIHVAFTTSDAKSCMNIRIGESELTLRIGADPTPRTSDAWTCFEQVSLSRNEMEQQFSRGIRRGWEILWPSNSLLNPSQQSRSVEHGELRFVKGQRLVVLRGTPQQVGEAHGELLKRETQYCIDSVLNAFGTVQTVATGRWFRDDLAAAYARLKPHIPEEHLVETRALAASMGCEPELLEQLNVFPELFHCSGFAVFNSATVDGKLYHGRVLDYMTMIGLQDCATTFVVSIDHKLPFANVGYAGFIGSVTGMNTASVSLGEMGGRGEGKWDGAPMATLMRRALEECSTLEQVKTLWSESPRTCEYYYVFSDGKTNQAVGVAATPESIEFIGPGEADHRLGEGITDAVVLSAGSRLETLRSRVIEQYGRIDVEKAIALMSRPVAMNSNLHNVLFVPADGVFYVANAGYQVPAADREYVKFDLQEILGRPLFSAQ